MASYKTLNTHTQMKNREMYFLVNTDKLLLATNRDYLCYNEPYHNKSI